MGVRVNESSGIIVHSEDNILQVLPAEAAMRRQIEMIKEHNTVIVSNVADHENENLEFEVYNLASKYGTIEKIRIEPSPSLKVFVEFDCRTSAVQAQSKLDGKLWNNRVIGARMNDNLW